MDHKTAHKTAIRNNTEHGGSDAHFIVIKTDTYFCLRRIFKSVTGDSKIRKMAQSISTVWNGITSSETERTGIKPHPQGSPLPPRERQVDRSRRLNGGSGVISQSP